MVILALAWLPIALSRKLIRMFCNYMKSRVGSAEDEQRIKTAALEQWSVRRAFLPRLKKAFD